MKRMVCLGVLLALLPLAAATAEGGQESSKVVSITYYDWQLTEEPVATVIREQVAAFEKENPNIKVVQQPVPTAQRIDKLVTLIMGNQAPDVAHISGADLTRVVDMKALVGLDAYLAKSPDLKKNLLASSSEGLIRRNVLYGIGRFASINTLMYNTAQYKAVGLNPDKPPVSWQDFVDYSKKLTRDSSGSGKVDRWAYSLLGAKTLSLANRYWGWLWSAGGDIVNATEDKPLLDTPEAIEAMKFYTDLSLVYKVVPPGVLDVDYPASTTSFIQEKTAMMCDGPFILGRMVQENPKLKAGIAAMPAAPGHQPIMLGGGTGLSLTAQSKSPDAGWKFIEYLSNAKNYWDYSFKGTQLPTRADTAARMNTEGSAEMAAFAKLVPQTKAPPALAQFGQIGNLLAEEVQLVLLGKKTAEEASKSLNSRVVDLLKR